MFYFHSHLLIIPISIQEIAYPHLTLSTPFSTYQQIEQTSAFNLTPQIKGPMKGRFRPNKDIEIQIMLKPEFLEHLPVEKGDAEGAKAYLLELGSDPDKNADHPLLQMDNWLCLSVKQQQYHGEVAGFDTFWKYMNLSQVSEEEVDPQMMADGIVDFVKDWAEKNFSEAGEKATLSLIDELDKTLDEMFEGTEEEEEESAPPQPKTLMDLLDDFLAAEEWPYVKIPDQPVLRMAYKGANGQWNCFLQAKETEQQLIMYSVYPVLISPERRSEVVEKITRINYGLIIGNFELDIDDGELRFKTSIDVLGTEMNEALIRRLVYNNVRVMDYYLGEF